MKWPRLLPQDITGVRFAVNVFIASTILWYLLRDIVDTNPIWAIASLGFRPAGEGGGPDVPRAHHQRARSLRGWSVLARRGRVERVEAPVSARGDRPRIDIPGPHTDNVAASANHGRHRRRLGPDATF
jgi:hypothetical protein